MPGPKEVNERDRGGGKKTCQKTKPEKQARIRGHETNQEGRSGQAQADAGGPKGWNTIQITGQAQGPGGRRKPASGPPPAGVTAAEANAHRLRTPEGRAAYKRRAPDVEGLHASLKDDGGLRRFSLRGLHNATSEFLFAGLAHNLRLLAAIS